MKRVHISRSVNASKKLNMLNNVSWEKIPPVTSLDLVGSPTDTSNQLHLQKQRKRAPFRGDGCTNFNRSLPPPPPQLYTLLQNHLDLGSLSEPRLHIHRIHTFALLLSLTTEIFSIHIDSWQLLF
jgi:hypothetical protein